METTIRISMDEVQVIDNLRRHSNKKAERLPSVFLFSAAIWSHSAHSWPGLHYMCKEVYETLGNKYIHYNYFSIRTKSSFVRRFVFCVCLICLGCYMHVSTKFAWK